MQLEKLEKRVKTIQMKLQNIGEMRPGSLNKQLTVCGRPGCRCQDTKKPKRHGPYYQLSYVHQGKSTTQFIQKEFVPTVTKELKNYKMFKALTTEWVDLALKIAREKLELNKQSLKIKPTTLPTPK